MPSKRVSRGDVRMTDYVKRCPMCRRIFAFRAGQGRDPVYCTKSCKQKAYRKRNNRNK